ncbi:MAG: PhnD/SsuA/transferrin family substrate-binding protein [Peptoniphilaceae bacterium]|uniref:phosphate/phosphite/phosphonate ABC transporter substrate-binding protein n=1 Tax=Parvimonas sp. TaxID=1944660 RepID=UPI0025D367DC|nr:PhnD/SsuA/transferrin family substrate-binding protein [Parvimonas sp.]MCI5998005.1 phosphate/phosphite/phosphonate ABC transporter substrate-binding protein [Parvimonas sp.]MDD7764409.1 PhnD/SsuA/transferrin family substrate-binding protein [Peptoniphilaceae bacterium]MDY3051381.1 PhnD/SsuA/transferrin family substrate-binding protein [Parvimonas sp.]
MKEKLKVGAVIYAPRVTVIWGIIADFFKSEGFEIEPVYYKDYKMQVDGLMKGEIDVAWNSPLAWLDTHLRTEGKALYGSMRDTDRDRRSYLVVRKGEINSISDLKGKTIGFGAVDSPQARLIPIYHLHKNGLEYKKDYIEKNFNIGVGLHGDHVGGELDSAKSLIAGEVDATWMLDMNYNAWVADGTLDEKQVVILDKTDFFDHCIFSARADIDIDRFNEFVRILNKMDYNNPDHKEMMDLEGLKEWVSGRLAGFEQITKANEYLNFFEEFYK